VGMADHGCVIVTGADTPTGLTTVRALRGLPVEVVGVLQEPGAAAAQSCYWSRTICIPGEALEQLGELVDRAKVGEFGDRCVLLFTQDSHVMAALEWLEVLREYFIVPLPARENGEIMMDKTRFHHWAMENDIEVPKAFIADDAQSVDQAIEKITFPCILKPLVRMEKWDSTFSSRKFFYLESVESFKKLIEDIDPFEYSERFILQEWVPGGDSEVYFVLFSFDADGKRLVRIGGRKLWQWAPLRGSTAVCQLWHDRALLEQAERIAKKLGMVGLGSIEFKRDHRSGKYFVTEPTVGRNDYQSDVATLMSTNPTEILVRTCLGIEDEIKSGSLEGKHRRGLWVDELSVYRYLKEEGGFRSFFKLIFWMIRNPRIHCLYFSWHDPWPFFFHFRNTVFGRRRVR